MPRRKKEEKGIIGQIWEKIREYKKRKEEKEAREMERRKAQVIERLDAMIKEAEQRIKEHEAIYGPDPRDIKKREEEERRRREEEEEENEDKPNKE